MRAASWWWSSPAAHFIRIQVERKHFGGSSATQGQSENLRILVSGRDPGSRDESNGQRPRQLLPDGLGQSVGGGWQLVGEDHRNDHLGKRRLDAQIVATGPN